MKKHHRKRWTTFSRGVPSALSFSFFRMKSGSCSTFFWCSFKWLLHQGEVDVEPKHQNNQEKEATKQIARTHLSWWLRANLVSNLRSQNSQPYFFSSSSIFLINISSRADTVFNGFAGVFPNWAPIAFTTFTGVCSPG